MNSNFINSKKLSQSFSASEVLTAYSRNQNLVIIFRRFGHTPRYVPTVPTTPSFVNPIRQRSVSVDSTRFSSHPTPSE